MSDAYADALGIADAPLKKPAPTGGFSAADWQAASAAQKFDGNSAAIASQEVAQAKTPADRAAALKTQAYTNAKIAQQGGAPAAANDPYADALGFGTASAAPTSPAVPAAAPKDDLQARIDAARAGESNSAGPALLQVGAHVITSGGSSLYGLVRGLGAMAGGGSLDDAVNEIHESQDKYTYNPPEGSGGANLLGMAGAKYSPLTLLGKATGALGDKTLSATGSPALATVADVGTNALATFGAGKALKTMATAKPTPVVPAARVEPTMETPPAAVANTPSPAVTDLGLAPKQPVPPKSPTFAGAEPPPPAASPAPRSAANAPTISDPEHGVFAPSAPDVSGGLPAAEQSQRAAILHEVGIQQARKSAISGDSNQAAIDFQTSRLKGSPAGDAMSQQLASEKQAITGYADNIARQTGGSSLNDQSAKLARGEAILTPLEGLKEWFDNQTTALYKTADERAQGVPTQLDNFRSVLGDDSLATNSDRVNLRTAAGAYAKKLGIIDDQGNVFANAQQAETMRKYLNENWSPQNSGLVGKLKDALDSDVMSAAGEDVYGQARALRAQRAATLDNPNGIAKLLDSSGPQGVNRSVPVEKVADTLTNMPVAQLENIVGTLKNMPPELQPMAQDALAEIKAQYAHNVKGIGANQQGQWNAKGVSQYLNNNSARMRVLFQPDEMKQFGTLNDAGNILAKDQSYPGAYAQAHNLLRAGVTHGITSGLTAAGGAVGGPLGGVIGNVAGGKLAGKFNDAATLRATQKRMVNVRDLLPDSDQ